MIKTPVFLVLVLLTVLQSGWAQAASAKAGSGGSQKKVPKKVTRLPPEVPVTPALERPGSPAGRQSVLFLKIAGGASFWGNTAAEAVTPALALELGIRGEHGAGRGALGMGLLVNVNGDGRSGLGSSILALDPQYVYRQPWGGIGLGLGMGVLFQRNYYSYAYSANTGAGIYSENGSGYWTGSRFALVPNITADYEVTSDLLVNLSVEYVMTFGPALRPSAWVPIMGLSRHF